MDGAWQHQIRIYLPDAVAEAARRDSDALVLRPLTERLSRLDATLVCQLSAFEAYVAEAEREGVERYPLYRWTKATVADPAMRAKHGAAFAVRVGGEEVYPREAADAVAAALQPFVGGDLVARMTKHDTNPATNIPVPNEYKQGRPRQRSARGC